MPRVFISYSWDSPEHKKWVSDLASKLRGSGIESRIDQWELSYGDQLPHFMETEIREADFVLIVCTPRYKEKSDQRIGGVGFEESIVSAEIFSLGNHRKYIPIVRSGDQLTSVPTFLGGKVYVDLREDHPDALNELLKTLHGVRPNVPPVAESFDVSLLDSGSGYTTQPQATEAPSPHLISHELIQRAKIIDERQIERILWRLPRTYLLFEDISYVDHSSWSTVVVNYDYDGNFIQGTHYHSSYARSWDQPGGKETQYRKLGIPRADWYYARPPIDLLMKLRESKSPVDIAGVVTQLEEAGYPVSFFAAGEPVFAPSIPASLAFEAAHGELRDIAELLTDAVETTWQTDDDFHAELESLKRRAVLEAYAKLGLGHPGYQLIKEVSDCYSNQEDPRMAKRWAKRLRATLLEVLSTTRGTWTLT